MMTRAMSPVYRFLGVVACVLGVMRGATAHTWRTGIADTCYALGGDVQLLAGARQWSGPGEAPIFVSGSQVGHTGISQANSDASITVGACMCELVYNDDVTLESERYTVDVSCTGGEIPGDVVDTGAIDAGAVRVEDVVSDVLTLDVSGAGGPVGVVVEDVDVGMLVLSGVGLITVDAETVCSIQYEQGTDFSMNALPVTDTCMFDCTSGGCRCRGALEITQDIDASSDPAIVTVRCEVAVIEHT